MVEEKETGTPDSRNLQSKGYEQTFGNHWLNLTLKLVVITEGENPKALSLIKQTRNPNINRTKSEQGR